MTAEEESGTAQDGRDDAAAEDFFTRHRELLFAVAYNILGTVSDTEDVLQETWLSWTSARRSAIADPRSYLVRIAVNEALGRLRRARGRREVYVGPWLPEPLVTRPPETGPHPAEDVAEAVGRAESVSLALMVVLETLTPLERAVFVLREVFGYEHVEIAEILGRSPAAVRQLAHRAREHVQARRPRYEPDPRVRRAATDRFLAASLGGDLGALMEVLAPDVALWTDGGGKRRAALRPIEGREKVARLLVALSGMYAGDLDVRHVDVNAAPAAVVFGSAVFAVLVVDLDPRDDRVCGIYGVINPDKLGSAREALSIVSCP
ncbi:RNA polymerase sigma factor SigJ [Actinomadura sp. HBU206391]|uniref:RNA polymerase sigma factor SigJ n=1 Tax=Actinomadura sp. HBU206391 TaxID=2731692 RepID=UPI001650C37A|nr:RNA polymerase sigma factor SigJ [Actinomadura sp. HBU206391]MBC6459974.1 RNA polymerase sigma factor SigJ [Actinomadura sp. HBU206391]